MLELFAYPFMQRAFIAGGVLALLLAALGVFATLRKMAFFGDGLAHSSLAGIAIALLVGVAPLPVAMVWAVAVALYIYRLERTTGLPSDTVIGIFFTASMALGVVLMSFTRGYQPDLVSYLFGSILSITTSDVWIIILVTIAVVAWILVSFRQLAFLSLSEESATVSGVPTRQQLLLLYISLAIATVLGVKILGIVLVSALLILPAATSRMLTNTFRSYFIGSIILAEVTVFTGLVLSYFYDLPSGATIVLVGTTGFLLATLTRRVA